ncbi:MAG: preprotein translocase subunit YajC [Oscillospiraceae bacterium]
MDAQTLSLFAMIAVVGVAFYFLSIRPQRKKDKQQQELRNSIEVGDEITTIGGIVGRVVSVKEDTLVLETAGERSRIRFKRWAIQDVGKLTLDSSNEGEAVKDKSKSDK